jgi:hypothetical protein
MSQGWKSYPLIHLIETLLKVAPHLWRFFHFKTSYTCSLPYIANADSRKIDAGGQKYMVFAAAEYPLKDINS